MTAERARAGAEWLALREPADAAARSPELVEILRDQLPARGRLTVHDLGCGTGSMTRWLSPQLVWPQHWVLHDRDAELLEVAAANQPTRSSDGTELTTETRLDDVTRLGQAGLVGADLVTTSALIDVLTTEELERLLVTCAGAACPVLITLTVTGRVVLTPADVLDGAVGEAFNAHQRRTTRDGRLLGPDAVEAAVDGFTRLGFDVLTRPSPWRLGPGQADLAVDWFTGWLAAACEQQPELRDAAAPYRDRRLAEAAAGRLSVVVQHRDVLAWPSRTRA